MVERVGGIEDRAPMTIPCTRCGGPIAPDEVRCPACDALAPLPDVDDTRADALLETAMGEGSPPWAVPIREPRASAADRRAPRALGVLALAVAALAATVVIGAQVLISDGGGDSATAAETDEPLDTVPDDDVDGEPLDVDEVVTGSSTTSAPTTTAPTTTTTSSTTTSTTTPPTTTRPAAPSGTGSVTELSSSFPGGWVAQLASVPFSAGTARLESGWGDVRAQAPGVVATRSDDWSSLSNGYWVLVEDGPFATADDVRAFCTSIGAGQDGCLPRELTGRR